VIFLIGLGMLTFHLVPAYQPDTAFTSFTRAIEGTDVGLGISIELSTFGTEGDANPTQTNNAPPMKSPTCFIRAVNETCNTGQKNTLAIGAGVVINGVLYAAASDWTPPAASISTAAGQPGNAPMSMMSSAPSAESTNTIPTGVYVATGTPTTSATPTCGAMGTGLRVRRAARRGLSLSMLFLCMRPISCYFWCGSTKKRKGSRMRRDGFGSKRGALFGEDGAYLLHFTITN